MGPSVRVSGKSCASMAAATAVSSVGGSMASTRNVHGNRDGGNPAESAGNPRGWGQS